MWRMLMSAVAGDTASIVSAQVMRRWQAIDPLLPVPGASSPGCGTRLIVAGSGGQPAAIGTCDHWEAAPGSLDLSWGAARRFQLTAQVAGPDVANALDKLLSLWRDHLACVPGADDEDIDAVVRLGLEVVRFDAHFGGVTERPDTADALRREAAWLVPGPEAWTWLAERDGTAIGMLAAQRPESAGWIAPMAGPAPVAYLMLMFVLPGERGSGVGAALVDRLHSEIDAAGVAVTLLHYAQFNPLSAPFWNQQGYRPLWTSWEARAARAIR